MILIKILCGCGQKYAFEVEPVGGHMSGTVQCPVCGLDGARAANEIIARHEAAKTPPPARPRMALQAAPPGLLTPPRVSTRAVQAAPRARGGSPKKWLWPAIGGAALLGLAWVGAASGLLPAQKAAPAGAAGVSKDRLPGALDLLAASYIEPPAGQNAAAIYSRGFDAMQIPKPAPAGIPLLGKAALPTPGAPLPAAMKPALSALIGSNDEALQLFAQGSGLERSRYSVDLRLGFETAFPHLPKVRSAVQLASLAGLLHAENHDGQRSAGDVLAALGLAGSLEAEPSLGSQFTRAACLQVAVGALEQSLNRVSLPPESLARIGQALQKLESCETRGEGFSLGLAAERAKWVALLAMPQKMAELAPALSIDLSAEDRARVLESLKTTGHPKEEREFFENVLRQVMAARQEPLPGRLKTEALIREQAGAAGPETILSARIMLPGFASCVPREAECLASLRLGLAAVALERYRAARQNRYPAALADLTPDYLPAPLLDPFDGKMLRYQTRGAGYLLYSIGPDLKDDSGKRLKGKAGDIVFAVVAPPKTAG